MANVCPASHKHPATGTCWTHHSCRCTPCSRKENRRVSEAYRHERRVKNLNRRIPAIGAARRLQALACMGWSCRAIAARTGIDIMHVNEMRRHLRGTVLLSTHHTVDKVFRELSIVRAEGRSASFTVKHAARNGWVSGMAWENIDNPRERPKGIPAREREEAK